MYRSSYWANKKKTNFWLLKTQYKQGIRAADAFVYRMHNLDDY